MPVTSTDTARESSRGALLAILISGILYGLVAFVPQVDGPPVETATAAQIRTTTAFTRGVGRGHRH